MIPLASPLAQYRSHQQAIDQAIKRVLESGHYILGDEVARFEEAFARYCGAEHGIGVASGTDALSLTLMAWGIGAGDEVITVANTAVATIAAILAAGATPVLVDADPIYRTMDAAQLEAAVTARTRAVIPVHLYGVPADMAAITALAQRHDLKVIEDCAQAAGARYGGARVGSLGDAGCFSFYPTKNLGALGDGGMVVTNDAAIAARLRRLRQYGWDEQRNAREAGVNSRLDVLQAAVLSAKLPSLDLDNARRLAIASRYDEAFGDRPLVLPARRDDSEPVYHLYVVECEQRVALIGHLQSFGIGAGVHYAAPVHRQPGYASRVIVAEGGLPVAERLCNHVVSLPIYPELADDDVDCVIAAVRSFFAA